MNLRQLMSFSCCIALGFAVTTADSNADTITLQRDLADAAFYPGGYDGVADNTIFYYSPSPGDSRHPARVMRSSEGAYVLGSVYNGSSSARQLIRWDLSSMAGQGIQVTSDATLSILTYPESAGGNPATVTFVDNIYQIAPANAGWTESTKVGNLFPWNTATPANDGDPTWYHKAVDIDAPNAANTDPALDTTSTKWASGHVNISNPGTNPESASPGDTGGLWNWIDLVDQDASTPVTDWASMSNMDPVSSAAFVPGERMEFTIPAAMIQSWIDDAGDNAGLLLRAGPGSSSSGAARTRTAEAGTGGPILTFDYGVVPEPSSLSLLGFGLLGCLRRRRK